MDQQEQRLQILQQYDILDTPEEEAFDNLAKLAAQICGTSAAQINFIDDSRQWAKANVGWGKVEMPKEQSFCIHTIQSKNSQLVIKDTLQDEQFNTHPLAKANPPLRFYTGVTVKSRDQTPLGTICVFDSEPKDLSDQQLEALNTLAKEVEAHLELRLSHKQLKENLVRENKLNKKIICSLPLNFFMYNSQEQIVRWNEYMESVTGYTDKEIKKKKPRHYFDENEREKVRKFMQKALQGELVTFEANFRKKDGTTSPYIFSATRFDVDDETFLLGTGQDITEQKKTQKNLEASLKEKETLLAEIHHRVKNNLAVISGLIQLETLDSEEEEADKKLFNTIHRIHSMALVHEIMYQTESLTHVVFENVIEAIIERVKESIKNTQNIWIISNVEKATLNINQAIPCGLIITELLTNALKHAFRDEEEGTVEIEMSENEKIITLQVADDGKGLPQNKGPESGYTMGFTLINQLCKQLEADIQIKRDGGTEFTIKFEKKDVKGTGSALKLG